MSKKPQISGILYGVIAGFAFSIFAWGVDGFLISLAHGAFPWVKFIPGLFICMISSGLIGWITIRIKNNILSVGFWLILAWFFSRLIIWLPINITPHIVKLFDSAIGEYLKYPQYEGLNQIRWVGFGIIAIVAIICGLLEIVLIEQSLFSSGDYAILVPLSFCFLCFSFLGNFADLLLNQYFRQPIQEVDILLQFASDNIDKEIPADIARSMHLGSTNRIKEYLAREYRLILSNFDESLGQVDILVDFEGYWVKCTTVFNQVTNCIPVFEESLFRRSMSVILHPVLRQ